MKEKIFFNKETIIGISLNKSKISEEFTFKKKSLLDKLLRSDKKYIVDYFYRCHCSFGRKYTIEEFEEFINYYIKDNQIFIKPYVKILFVNNKTIEKYFESEKEAQDYIDSIITDNFFQYEK